METTIDLGDKVKDRVTGLEGIVYVIHDYMYGVNRVGFRPQGTHQGKEHEAIHVDMPQVELVSKGEVKVPKKEVYPIEHGDKVKCKITGFKGVAVGKATWLYGCYKTLVQPQKLIPVVGTPAKSEWIDTPQLEITKPIKKESKKVQKKLETKKSTGGFNDNISSRPVPSERRL